LITRTRIILSVYAVKCTGSVVREIEYLSYRKSRGASEGRLPRPSVHTHPALSIDHRPTDPPRVFTEVASSAIAIRMRLRARLDPPQIASSEFDSPNEWWNGFRLRVFDRDRREFSFTERGLRTDATSGFSGETGSVLSHRRRPVGQSKARAPSSNSCATSVR